MRPRHTNLQVVIRIRPPSDREAQQNNTSNTIKILDDRTIIFDPDERDSNDFYLYHGHPPSTRSTHGRVKKKMPMTFDHVYTQRTTNAELFTGTMNEMITTLLAGHNCCAFVYGATGAGKTFTMLGNDRHPGVAHMTVEHLFKQIEMHNDERQFEMAISYLEVYNEQIKNLLANKNSERLKLQEINNVTVVCGLRLMPIANVTEMMTLLLHGNRNRTQHPTDSNAESSRSHAIFQCFIRMHNRQTGRAMSVKMSLIDLAGSERAVGFKCNGVRLKEGANINRSLLALGNCINKLADGGAHIPYRDSNLTRIIKDSLGGNCQTLMIANVSPSMHAYEDTYNTLKYAMRAKKIRVSLKMVTGRSKPAKSVLMKKIADQQATIGRLNEEMKALKAELRLKETAIVAKPVPTNNAMPVEWLSQIDGVVQSLRQATDLAIHREKINLRAKVKSSVEDLRRLAAIHGETNYKDTNVSVKPPHQYDTSIQGKANEVFRLKTQLIEKESVLKKLIRKCSKNELECQLKPLLTLKNNLETVRKSMKCIAELPSATPYIPMSQSAVDKLSDIQNESIKLLCDNNLLTRCTNKLYDNSFERNAECATSNIDYDQQIRDDNYLTDIDDGDGDLNVLQSTYRLLSEDTTTCTEMQPKLDRIGNGKLAPPNRISKLKKPKDYRKRTPKTSSSRKKNSKFHVNRNV